MTQPILTEAQLKDLCWQCRFSEVVEKVDGFFRTNPGVEATDEGIRLRIVQARALFERHELPRVSAIYERLVGLKLEGSEDYLYSVASFHYHDEKYAKAEAIFSDLVEQSETLAVFNRSKLALANIYIAQKKWQKYRDIVPDLEELSEVVPLDEKIIYYLQKANGYRVFTGQVEEAKKLFQQIITMASARGWSYFIIRALEGMAQLQESQGHHEAVNALLDVISSYFRKGETQYLQYLVHKKYKNLRLPDSSSLKLDRDNQRVAIGEQWLELSQKPLLFSFLTCLYQADGFCSKQDIAGFLWPDQEYRGKIHDPRIFDIARRIRVLIEPYENQPITLLSSRLGYKLSGKQLDAAPTPPVAVVPEAPEAPNAAPASADAAAAPVEQSERERERESPSPRTVPLSGPGSEVQPPAS